jgi:hypothetical protein
MTERIRFTIAVDAHVHEAFADLAHSTGVSMSRCVGDWLRDTAEAAQMTTVKVNAVRKAPADALHVFLRDAILPGMEEVRLAAQRATGGEADVRRVRIGRSQALLAPAAAGPAKPVPPSSNTGGKSPGKPPRPV